ncbi:hypothetical protein U1Q18_023923, partial [Sarracenia purpurea var. burkii]
GENQAPAGMREIEQVVGRGTTLSPTSNAFEIPRVPSSHEILDLKQAALLNSAPPPTGQSDARYMQPEFTEPPGNSNCSAFEGGFQPDYYEIDK